MSRRALAGGYGPAQKDGSKRSRTTPAPPDPRDFALAVMRDESQPMALRAQMAKAALPYAHKRGEAQEAEEKPQRRKYSDLELARRIAHIMALGRQQAEREGKPFPEIGDEDIAPEPVPGGRPRGGPPDWENSRAVVHRSVSAAAQTPPGRSFHSRPPEGEGEEKSSPHKGPASAPASAAVPQLRPPVERPWIPAAIRAQMDNIDPSFFKVERIIETDWPDEHSSRRTRLPERANRSPRKAEEGEW